MNNNTLPQPDSEYGSEEKTEPFSSSEYASRLHALHVRESLVSADGYGPVHLDELVVPPDKDIRLLVRPLRSRSVSPGNTENCEWVALRAEVSNSDQPQETVLAVTQTSKDIKFTVLVPGEHTAGVPSVPPLLCELYYDPASDNQILLNNGDFPIALTRVSPSLDGPGSTGIEYTVNPGTTKALSPGTWRIRIIGIDVLDFRILEKRKATIRRLALPPTSDVQDFAKTPNSSGKRTFVAVAGDAVGPDPRRQKTLDKTAAQAETNAIKPIFKDTDNDKDRVLNGDGSRDADNNSHQASNDSKDKDQEAVIMFLRPTADPLVFPLPTSAKGNEVGTLTNGNALLALGKGDTADLPGGCEMDTYQLTRREPIASTALSKVFTGTTDHPSVPPESVITVKVIKTRPPATASARGGAGGTIAAARPQETERNVIRQADTWLREYQSHEYLQHNSIVRLYGGDARHLSLYMEHVDGHDLSAKGVWRAANSDYFTGDRQDATRILRDIAGALQYIHGRNLVHNDIKPANILYSRERGAVLCDFGLTTHTNNRPSAGGTPYYVPPEFIGRKLRGAPSDVWALGITMLYVLRKISFPDSRGRHQARPLYWMIADVNAPSGGGLSSRPPGGPGAPGLSAMAQMQMWLSEVSEAKEKLNREDKLERLAYEMLAPNRAQRIPIHKVVKELYVDSAN